MSIENHSRQVYGKIHTLMECQLILTIGNFSAKRGYSSLESMPTTGLGGTDFPTTTSQEQRVAVCSQAPVPVHA